MSDFEPTYPHTIEELRNAARQGAYNSARLRELKQERREARIRRAWQVTLLLVAMVIFVILWGW